MIIFTIFSIFRDLCKISFRTITYTLLHSSKVWNFLLNFIDVNTKLILFDSINFMNFFHEFRLYIVYKIKKILILFFFNSIEYKRWLNFCYVYIFITIIINNPRTIFNIFSIFEIILQETFALEGWLYYYYF